MKKLYPEPIRRKTSKNYYFWYYDSDSKRRLVSTGISKPKEAARQFIRDYIDRRNGGLSQTFRDYAEPFYTDDCPKVRRMRETGRTIGDTHIKKSRSWLTRHVFTDKTFSNIPLNEIRRADVLDLRSRLVKSGLGLNTINKTIITVQGILSEAHYRQDLSFNPADNLGTLHYEKQEKVKLEAEEIRQLLSYTVNPIGLEVSRIEKEIMSGKHKDFKTAYYSAIKERLNISIPEAEEAQREALTALFLAYLICTGTRAGEARAIKWEALNMDTGRVIIDKAFKSDKELGLPKWNKIREIVIPASLLSQLKKQKSITYYDRPSDFIFSNADRKAVGITWIRKNLLKYLTKIDKDPENSFKLSGRQITPHVYRHSLNTNLLAAEVSPLLVQTFLGWSSEEGKILTKLQNGYTGFQLLRLETVSEAIEKMYFTSTIKQAGTKLKA